MDSNCHGLYYVLGVLPIWATIFIFYLLTLFVVDAGREVFEGFSYNVSHAARYGDIGLFICIIIGVTVLQRNPVLKGLIATDGFQVMCAGISMVICFIMVFTEIIMHFRDIGRQKVDIYHNVIILPLFIYLLLALIPVIYFHGTKFEQQAVLFFFFIWFCLTFLDFLSGRLKQQEWLIKHGFGCILK